MLLVKGPRERIVFVVFFLVFYVKIIEIEVNAVGK